MNMQVGDLVKVNEDGWRDVPKGSIGIVTGFENYSQEQAVTLFVNGREAELWQDDLELLNNSRR
jgi:hypothetical protein